jgi:signal transduction histidine kinase/CheY-like chemotaxis protein
VTDAARTQQAAQLEEYRAEIDGLRAELDATSQGLLAMHRELSEHQEELEQARVAAVRADRAKAAFLASMSHEIRSPLNVALGFASLLGGTALTAEQAEYTETLLGACNHLRDLVDGILDLSKVESGLLELEEAPFDLVACVEAATGMVALGAEKKSVALAALFTPGIPEIVVGDAVRMRQILVNLLSNAVKFTAAGQVCVEVTARPAGTEPHCRFTFDVRDTGPGIPEETMSRLFQPFAQASTSITRQFGGTGLGLSITRQLAERMGGGVTVTSTPGEGATFTATVMLRRGEPVRPGSRAEPPLAGTQVLVVHPESVIAEAIRRHLVAWGARTLVTDSVTDAARYSIRWNDVALAIVGLGRDPDAAVDQPPGSDPISAIHALARSRDQPLPVVAVTPLAWRRRPAEPFPTVPTVTGTPIRRDRLRDAILDALGLPGMTANGTAPAGSASALSPALNVLVVDDQAANQRALALMLNQSGHQADVVGDGEAAVAAIIAGNYDLVLMDVQMPRLDGIAATRQARLGRPGEQPPIIAITADATPQTRESCLRAGMNGFLSKPIARADLIRAISAATEQRSPTASTAARPPCDDANAAPAIRVLYIDDNPMLRTLVERILAREAGLALVTAADGRAGLDLAVAHRPDVILVDLHLPDMGGEQIIQELRREPRTSGIPIIVVSGDVSPGTARRLADLGATEHIAKPFDAGQLKASIAAASRRSAPA